MAEQLQVLAKNYIAILPETQEKITLKFLELQTARVETNVDGFRYFFTFDPSATLKQVRVPILVLNGELGLQVSSKQNLFGIFAALAEFERELISERTKAGLVSARSRGTKVVLHLK